ncbi:MAG: Wss1p-related putative metallopeptidase [Myxococcota bacterium]
MDRGTSRLLMESLNRDAQRIASCFGLRYRAIEAERANVKSRYGICYSDGLIKIRLRHATTGRPLKYSSLVSTLCHELAHLRHFNHGVRFRAFYQELLEFARDEGIYRPGSDRARAPAVAPPPRRPQRAPGPEQLSLFGSVSGSGS